MNKLNCRFLGFMLLIFTAALTLSSCSGISGGAYSEGQTYYDQYMDRPGYYDFGRPVIFVPE